MWQSFLRYRHLLANLIKRDLKVKYRRSTLGILWSMLNPLLMMMILSAVFSYMFKSAIANYPVYLMIGQLTFGFFSESTNTAMTSMLSAASLIKKVYIPKYIFPMEKVLFSLINIAFTSIALIIVMLYSNMSFELSVICVPFIIGLLTIFNIGIGLLLATVTVFFRDIVHLYGVLTMALMYFTPIIYPVSALPEFMRSAVSINPMYWYVGTMRDIIMGGVFPTMDQWIACFSFAIISIVIGLIVFKKQQDKFILYV